MKYSTCNGGWQYPMYNALGERVQDDQPDASNNPRYLMYPRGIAGHRMEVFEYHPSVGWTGSDVWWARVVGERLEMGGSTSYLAHTDAVGSMVMETDQTGASTYDTRIIPGDSCG